MSFLQRLSQIESLPELKLVHLGQTIGQGTFAVVKIGQLRQNPTRLVAVKFIHRRIAHSKGLNDEKIGLEVRVHKECSGHPNVINLHMFGTDNTWVYLVMELAESGDLFDKIEPDVGVDEELANFYFKQLINAVDYIHQKGVAHRDIKPENILVSKEGNLKLADFGLATVIKRKNRAKRLSRDVCGSPPYMAPEIVIESAYDATLSDVWACGIVLFVLLTGQIPWQEPNYGHDKDFTRYVDFDGKVRDQPWIQMSSTVRALLRLIIHPNIEKRLSIDHVRLHPWVNQANIFMDSDQMCNDSLGLAERLLSQLEVGLSDENVKHARTQLPPQPRRFISNSQPVNDMAAMIDDIDNYQLAYTQDPVERLPSYNLEDEHERILDIVSKDPAILQFRTNTLSQMTNTQQRLKEFTQLPFRTGNRLTRFFSVLPLESLLPILRDSLHRMGVSTADSITEDHHNDNRVFVAINILGEKSRMPLKGFIKIVKCDPQLPLRRIEFIKTKGDPLEWRNFFKKVTILLRDAVYVE
jgi:Serine/threonine protein kinase